MKLASFKFDGIESFGIVEGDDVVDIGSQLKEFEDLDAFIAAGMPVGVSKSSARRIPYTNVEWLPVIRNPRKIFCIGLNYRTTLLKAPLQSKRSRRFSPVFHQAT